MSARVGVLLLAAACLAIECSAHTDDTDASLYAVVARNLVHDASWTRLRYTENVHAQYFEHLPFGLWPSAVVVKTLGEGALPWLSAGWTLATIALLMELARRKFDDRVAVLAGLLLATTHQFIVTGALHRLDPPLVFFSLLSVVPLLTGDLGGRGLAVSALASAIAVAIKGPFGLVLPVGATIARAVSEKSVKWLVLGGLTCVLALVPTALFLATAGPDWWAGYVDAQLLASARGARTDGTSAPWFPLVAIGTHFWPWLFLVPLALWKRGAKQPAESPTRSDASSLSLRQRGEGRGEGPSRALPIVLWLLASLLILTLPGRKLWHHVLLLFPGLALLAATTVPLERLKPSLQRAAFATLCAVSLTVVAFAPRSRAVSCSEFGDTLRAQPTTTRVLVVSSGSPWRELGVLASELHLRPWLEGTAEAAPPDVRWAVVTEDRVPSTGWTERQRARGWVLLAR